MYKKESEIEIFANCESLKNISIPENTKVHKNAFLFVGLKMYKKAAESAQTYQGMENVSKKQMIEI